MAGSLHIGTSGWSYPHWRDGFFRGVPRARWLAHLAAHFDTVEVNASFYRRLAPATLARWAAATPDDFLFSLKGHRAVTHLRRLRDVAAEVAAQRAASAPLGARLACVLWQAPPGLHADAALLAGFLEVLGTWPGPRHVLEFRHRGWFTDAVAERLAAAGVAHALSDAGRWPRWDAVTTDLVYVRLHGRPRTYASAYGEAGLRPWAERISAWRAEGRDVFVYFDNDAAGAAPEDARILQALCGFSRRPPVPASPAPGAGP
ncbi:DUF72 domain-containing protein [Inmirania thermothiophila]|uniref:Uncharacterized protein YecE (DUF72 family) n=1 Tax=Inmirania thermothiophila TaxID=1750597 RepID=A0A3N1Y9T9_9GAMM|nr:DUF72 domain-containing protein [Inmirania thermothiophila]ROR34382.1 uncharacterized protein YecE (DUF72 family) [Inmirania thermothiophila]